MKLTRNRPTLVKLIKLNITHCLWLTTCLTRSLPPVDRELWAGCECYLLDTAGATCWPRVEGCGLGVTTCLTRPGPPVDRELKAGCDFLFDTALATCWPGAEDWVWLPDWHSLGQLLNVSCRLGVTTCLTLPWPPVDRELKAGCDYLFDTAVATCWPRAEGWVWLPVWLSRCHLLTECWRLGVSTCLTQPWPPVDRELWAGYACPGCPAVRTATTAPKSLHRSPSQKENDQKDLYMPHMLRCHKLIFIEGLLRNCTCKQIYWGPNLETCERNVK